MSAFNASKLIMKIKATTFLLLFIALTFSACKTDNSKNADTEIKPDSVEIKTTSQVEKQEEDEEVAENIRKYITTKYLTEADLRAISEDQRKFQYQLIDLNNDGTDEVFVNFTTSYFCGTGGCNVLLLNHQFEPITKFTVTQIPLYAEQSTENDWRILLTKSEGKWRKLIYKDGTYPSNSSVAETTNTEPTEDTQLLFAEDNQLETYDF